MTDLWHAIPMGEYSDGSLGLFLNEGMCVSQSALPFSDEVAKPHGGAKEQLHIFEEWRDIEVAARTEHLLFRYIFDTSGSEKCCL
jgi:hypothetical protein